MSLRSPISGFLLGLLLPLLGSLIVYAALFRGSFSLGSFGQILVQSPAQSAKVLSLAIIPNMLALMYFNRRKNAPVVRGIMAVNVIWIVLFVLQRFVWS